MEQTYFENSKSVLNNVKDCIEDVVRYIDCRKENISITISDIRTREKFKIERVLYNYNCVHFVGKHGENIYLSFLCMSVFDICNIADELRLVCNKKCKFNF